MLIKIDLLIVTQTYLGSKAASQEFDLLLLWGKGEDVGEGDGEEEGEGEVEGTTLIKRRRKHSMRHCRTRRPR